jgi:hypothetical protein
MADTIGMADIRGLDIDKVAKGYAERTYIFKNLCTVSSMEGDSIRWYQRTAAHLTATSPSTIPVAPLAQFTNLEVSWTRYTSYPRKYGVEGFISNEDIKSADPNVLTTTIEQLTFAVVKAVDADIFTVITDTLGTGSAGVNTVTSTAAWGAGSGQDPIEDCLEALYDIESYDYDTSTAVLVLSPLDKKTLLTWLISTKGTSIQNFASTAVVNGELTKFLGMKVLVSNNVTADYAVVLIPQKAATFKQYTPTTARTIEEVGLGQKIRVWEAGITLLTDPKAVTVISNTQ